MPWYSWASSTPPQSTTGEESVTSSGGKLKWHMQLKYKCMMTSPLLAFLLRLDLLTEAVVSSSSGKHCNCPGSWGTRWWRLRPVTASATPTPSCSSTRELWTTTWNTCTSPRSLLIGRACATSPCLTWDVCFRFFKSLFFYVLLELGRAVPAGVWGMHTCL